MSAPHGCPAGRQQTRVSLSGCLQTGPGDVQDPRRTLLDMNNLYDSPVGAGPASGPYPAGTPDPSAGSRKKRFLRWGAGVTLAGFLAGGGIAFALSGSGTPAASATSTTSTAQSAQAAVLNSAFSTAGSTAANVPLRRIRWAIARLRALGGVHGEVTYHNAAGFHTLAFERGRSEEHT